MIYLATWSGARHGRALLGLELKTRPLSGSRVWLGLEAGQGANT